MARTYVKAKRAENQAETRRRIVEATVDLHTELGPALTTVSMIAERAGVQRHTFYAHFPDDRSLRMACSGLAHERDPMPDPEQWSSLNDPESRLRAALTALYGWYGRNSDLTRRVLRDADFHEVTRETVATQMGPRMDAITASLEGGLDARGKAALALSTSFHTWRTQVEEAGLSPAAAVELGVATVLAARQN